ncbi:DUF4169 family protein [Chelatococcus reniformis]|uniref:DUF4169 domain-containing protein n=1 Tax=Chelatococcus reniformis TaxID=1494448 RepID=A0A916UR21_9HYPH|nr:DUF4169 family protein [Chelatococcus reniformis]GGC84108.1 hypothetical protein GCM10010994_47510 [Chelatococcus reniformis]
MAEIVNLRNARKARQRAEHETLAAANRTRFGRTKAERAREEKERDAAARQIDGHRLEQGAKKSTPVFGQDPAQNKELEQGDDSRKNLPALDDPSP